MTLLFVLFYMYRFYLDGTIAGKLDKEISLRIFIYVVDIL